LRRRQIHLLLINFCGGGTLVTAEFVMTRI
jgi:hypothetical protein